MNLSLANIVSNNTVLKMAAAACSLSLLVSTQAGSAWARGSGGGHPSGMGRSNGHYTTNNFVRPTQTNFTQSFNGANHFNNFTKVNTTSRVGNFKSNFGNKFQFQKLTKKGPSGPFWKKYGGWGKFWGPWDFGWGWGCWDSPYCYGWCWYEPIPVVAYYNPYCDCAGTVVDGIDYSVPIASQSNNAADGDPSDLFAAARDAFAQGDLDSALKAISAAALQSPHNQDVHEFHSLVLFAKKDYCKAASVAHAVLEAGPGWTWDTLQTLYASPEAYTEQLRQLEHYVSEHPSEANVRFLLGYHYFMLNHPEAAQRQIAQVVELEPKDKLAANILSGLMSESTVKTTPAETAATETAATEVVPVKLAETKSAETKTAETKPAEIKSVPTPPASTPAETNADEADSTPIEIPPAKPQAAPVVTAPVTTAPVAEAAVAAAPIVEASPLSGTFKANPAKGVEIELTLRGDKTFAWKFTANGKAQNFSGKYVLGDKSLVLTREDGESMDGTLARTGDGFKFRMIGAEANDPGLTFSR